MRKVMRIALLLAVLISGSFNSFAVVPKTENPAQNEKITAEALKEWKSISKKERRLRIKEVRKELNSFKRDKRNGKDEDERTILLVILAILLPPLAVYLHQGEINTKFWISLILTLLFWLPGVIYALIVVLS